MIHLLPLDLVGVRLLQLLTTDETLEVANLAVAAGDGSLEKLLLLGRQRASGLGSLLLVDSILVTPLDVLRRRLLEVLLDVVEGVLGDVGDTKVGVLLDAARVREGLAGEELDEGRLSGSVGSNWKGEKLEQGKRGQLDGRTTYRYRLGKRARYRRRR